MYLSSFSPWISSVCMSLSSWKLHQTGDFLNDYSELCINTRTYGGREVRREVRREGGREGEGEREREGEGEGEGERGRERERGGGEKNHCRQTQIVSPHWWWVVESNNPRKMGWSRLWSIDPWDAKEIVLPVQEEPDPDTATGIHCFSSVFAAGSIRWMRDLMKCTFKVLHMYLKATLFSNPWAITIISR